MKRNHLRHYILTALLALTALAAQAQVHVEAKLDSLQILIGQQTMFTINVTARQGAKVDFPQLQPRQYIAPGVEVVESFAADTSAVDGQTQVTKAYSLTSFDEKLYSIPAMTVKVDGKDYQTNALALKVITVDVDTIHPEKFFPPKDVQDNPFLWAEWSPVFWMSFLLLLLLVVACYLVVRLKQNKPIITRIRIIKHEPPHQKALRTIEKLRGEQPSSAENQKEYYTRLTDALRQYIDERFGFNAMEMTSTEILYHLQQAGDQTMLTELRELFYTADLVKFAKHSTMLNENDLNLVNAIHFIDQTKMENQPTEERIVPKLSEEDERTRNNRIVIKSIIAVVAVAVAVLLCVVVYKLYMLLQ